MVADDIRALHDQLPAIEHVVILQPDGPLDRALRARGITKFRRLAYHQNINLHGLLGNEVDGERGLTVKATHVSTECNSSNNHEFQRQNGTFAAKHYRTAIKHSPKPIKRYAFLDTNVLLQPFTHLQDLVNVAVELDVILVIVRQVVREVRRPNSTWASSGDEHPGVLHGSCALQCTDDICICRLSESPNPAQRPNLHAERENPDQLDDPSFSSSSGVIDKDWIIRVQIKQKMERLLSMRGNRKKAIVLSLDRAFTVIGRLLDFSPRSGVKYKVRRTRTLGSGVRRKQWVRLMVSGQCLCFHLRQADAIQKRRQGKSTWDIKKKRTSSGTEASESSL